MKVVQIVFSPYPKFGGPAINYVQFHEALEARSVGFSKWAEYDPAAAVVPCVLNVRSGRDRLSSRYYRVASAERARVLAELEGAELVLLHGYYMGPFAWICLHCLAKGIPYIIIPHGIFDPWAESKTRLLKRLWMRLYGDRIIAGAACVLCSTRGEADKIAAAHKGLRLEILPWGAPSLPAPARSRAAVRAELGLAADAQVFFSIGRLHRMKRPVELARAFARCAGPRQHLLFMGPEDGVSATELLEGIPSAARSRILVRPPVFGPAKFDYYGACDFYISASHRENFNFTAVEAMGSGLPCVLSEGNDLLGELQDKPFVLPLRGDPVETLGSCLLAAAILSPERCAQLGSEARAWVNGTLARERFDEGVRRLATRLVRGGREEAGA